MTLLRDLSARLLPGLDIDQARTQKFSLLIYLCQISIYLSIDLIAFLIGQKASSKMLIYILSFTLAPLLALITGLFLERLRQQVRPAAPFWECLLIFNMSYGVFAAIVSMFHASNVGIAEIPLAMFPFLEVSLIVILIRRPDLIHRSLIGLAVLTLLVFWLVSGAPQTAEMFLSLLVGVIALSLPVLAHRNGLSASVWLVTGLALVIMGITAFFALPPAQVWAILPVALICFLMLRQAELSAGRRWLIDGVTLAWIGLIVIDLSFEADLYHYNAYLAPVNDVIHGKTLLVDSNNGYGILHTYLMAGILGSRVLPSLYIGLSIINSVLIWLQISLMYALLRLTIRQPFLPALAALSAAAILYSDHYLYLLPSAGPLRFLPSYVMLLLIALRLKDTTRAGLWKIMEAVILALSATWSLEALIYTSSIYVGTAFYEALMSRKWHSLPGQFLIAGLSVLVGEAGMSGLTYLRSGQWPDWQLTLDILTYYFSASGTDIYARLPALWDSWLIISGVYLASLIQNLLSMSWTRTSTDSNRIIAFAVTVCGMAHFVYWVGNSQMETAQILPAIYLITFWISRLSVPDVAHSIRLSSSLAASSLATLCMVIAVSNMVFSPRLTVFQALIGQRRLNWDQQPLRVITPLEINENVALFAPDLIHLIATNTSPGSRVALIAPLDSGIYALIETDTANALPLTFPSIESVSMAWRHKVDQAIDFLHTGDHVIVTYDFSLFYPIQQQVIERLCQDFALVPIQQEETAALFELAPPGSAGACSCTLTGMVCSAPVK